MKDVSYLTDKELIDDIALLFAELMNSLRKENSLTRLDWADRWNHNDLMMKRITELYNEISRRS